MVFLCKACFFLHREKTNQSLVRKLLRLLLSFLVLILKVFFTFLTISQSSRSDRLLHFNFRTLKKQFFFIFTCAIWPEWPKNACRQRISTGANLAYDLLISTINGLICQNGQTWRSQFEVTRLFLVFRFKHAWHVTVFIFARTEKKTKIRQTIFAYQKQTLDMLDMIRREK